MRNIIGPFKDCILRQYDLKGSTHNRKEHIDEDTDLTKETLKDLNFEELEQKIILPKKETFMLTNQLEEDSYFLSENHLMDYSLLLTIVKPDNLKEIVDSKIFNKSRNNYIRKEFLRMTSANEVNLSSLRETMKNDTEKNKKVISDIDSLEYYRKFMFLSSDKTQVYIISVIDFLQVYHFFKQLETNYKFFVKTRPENIYDISCIPPDMYQDRFMKYMHQITIDFDNDEEVQIYNTNFDEDYKNMINNLTICVKCGALVGKNNDEKFESKNKNFWGEFNRNLKLKKSIINKNNNKIIANIIEKKTSTENDGNEVNDSLNNFIDEA